MIVVGASVSLRKLDWLRLVEIAPSRYLLAVPTGTALEELELAVVDLMESLEPKETYERQLLTELHRALRICRRQRDASKVEILLLRREKIR